MIGLKIPAKKNWGNITKVKIWPAISWLLRFERTSTPNAPPSRQTSRATRISPPSWAADARIPTMNAKAMTLPVALHEVLDLDDGPALGCWLDAVGQLSHWETARK